MPDTLVRCKLPENSAERSEFEAQMHSLFRAGEFRQVVTGTLQAYGPEIFGFLLAIVSSEHDAADIFGDFSFDLWAGITVFEWRCSLRTWVYTLARHQLGRFDRTQKRERRHLRRTPMTDIAEILQLAAQLSSETLPHLKSEAKSAFVLLRERLDPEDQMLLILRVDRDLAWTDVASVMGGVSAAALRKRFERLKERLHEMARAEKLVSE
ncbi:RNA polymerase sigma factor [Polyangium mundeleinium]|uniref:Sigma-70 family RNA polymerase sigma factor n=1 Tax=Polyangium mundeleinium TaxID=2995306 RepID=A0ABT5F050_9BACT|nr:sigma-70 family RNA polymerase sigma factor [Polyangium mundeleinium]MDC0746441.1 sigma-70 family RNA polymerase sigma factor [Polyangium mundeleinium]